MMTIVCLSILPSIRGYLFASSYGTGAYRGIRNTMKHFGSKSRYNEVKEMVALFDACRRPILSKNVTSIGEFTRDEERITKVAYGAEEGSIEAYVLPSTVVKWPSFYNTVQKQAIATEVLCIRTDMMNNVRRQMIIENTLLGHDSITKGPFSIGKSSESNYLLLEFLRNIGQEGYPRNVLYRIPGSCVLEFSLDAENKSVVKKISNFRSFNDIYSITQRYNHKDSVMFLEIGESEKDPTSEIPCIVTASCDNFENTYKTLSKSGATVYLAELPSPKQLVEQVKAIRLLSQDSGEFQHLSLEQCIETAKERVAIVGPITRFVFSEHQFNRIRSSIIQNSFFHFLHNMDIDNIPENIAQFFVGPVFKEGALVPKYIANMPNSNDFIYRIEFVSLFSKNVAASQVSRTEIVDILRRHSYQLDSQIAEGMMVQALFETLPTYSNFAEECARNNWVIHKDPGYRSKLSKSNLLGATETKCILDGSAMPWASSERFFRGAYCSQDVSTLDERVVYRSRTNTFSLGDNLMVNHATKEVWLFQPTVVNPARHPLIVATLKTVMEKLNMFDGVGKEYKVVILVFTDDKLREVTQGCKFMHEKKEAYEVVEEDEFTLSELQRSSEQSTSELMNRVKTYVVCSVYYPKLQKQLEYVAMTR